MEEYTAQAKEYTKSVAEWCHLAAAELDSKAAEFWILQMRNQTSKLASWIAAKETVQYENLWYQKLALINV